MQRAFAPVLLVSLWATRVWTAIADQADPLGKVIELIDSLATKVTSDGVAEEKVYHEYFEWCDESSKQKEFDIKSGTATKEKLEATISKAGDDIEAAVGKIEDLAMKIKTGEKELSDATLIREKEAAEFAKGQSELVDAVDTLGRASGIIEKEMAKNPASFAQVDTSSLDGLVSALGTIVDAAGFGNADKEKLVALMQTQSDDEDMGAPAPDAYKSHSKGIVEVLEDMKDKAETQLSELRKAESNAKHNFDMLKQGLEDQIAQDTKNKDEETAFKAECEETMASSKAELVTTIQDLEDAKKSLASIQAECMRIASDHEASVAGRAEELKVIAEAKKIILETTEGAAEQTYSLLEVGQSSKLRTGSDLKKAEVLRMVRQLAKAQHSSALAQLASRIAALARFGAQAGEDPFVKIKGLIGDMITKLEKEADAAADEKAYCDEQMSKTEAKKSELEDDVSKLTSKIDTKSSQSLKLKEEVKELQEELQALAKESKEMTAIRGDAHEAYVKAKADLELGLKGVGKALSVLRKYYGGAALLQSDEDQPAKPVFHSKSSGAGGSIIDILTVCESDFAKSLADEETQESDELEAYNKRMEEIKQSTAIKSKDVEYKTQNSKNLDTAVAELSETREATDKELSAVLEYYGKVKERCVAKPETYEERKARREKEINGLKEALAIMEDQTALVQVKKARTRRDTRGHLHAFVGLPRE